MSSPLRVVPVLPQDRAVLRGMVLIATFAAIAALARLGQDAAIAWRFGADATVDAYYYLLTLVSWPVTIAASTLTFLVAPVHARLASGSPAEASRFWGELLGLFLLIAVCATPLCAALLGLLAGSDAAFVPASVRSGSLPGQWALVWLIPLGIVGALFAAWMIAAGRQALTLVEAVPALMLMSVLLVSASSGSLFWGTVAGSAAQVAVLAAMLRWSRSLPHPRLGRTSTQWSGLMRGSFTLLASQILFAAVPLIDPLLAADLGEAAVATISFANRLVLGLQGLLGVAVQRTSLPMLALLAAQDAVGSRRVALRWALLAAGAGIFIGVAVLTFADALVSLLLERGRFTAENRAAVAQLVRIGALQLPCFMAGLVLVAALAAQGRRAELAWVAIAGVTVKCVFSAALAPAHGLAGLMLSTAFMYLATALVAWFCVVRKPAT